MDHSSLNYSSTSMFTAHTMGNVASFMKERLTRAFLPGYFKTSNVSTTISYRYFDLFKNTPPHIFKKAKPFMNIQPRFDTNIEDYFMSGSYLTTRLTDVFSGENYGNLLPILSDDKRGLEIRFLMNRMRCHFEVNMVFESQMEQLNIFNHLRNQFVWDRQTLWGTILESHIPREIIAGASHITGHPMNCPAELLRYLNKHSNVPITYKMKTSTGNDEYFTYLETPLDILFSNLDLNDGGRIGMVDDVYGISFTITTEFTTPGVYHIFTREGVPNTIIANEASMEPRGDGKLEMQFTPTDDMGIRVPEGWEIVGFPSYRVESDPPSPDILDVSAVLLDSINKLIDYHVEHSIPTDNFIKFYVTKDAELMSVENGDYILDLPNRKLYTYLLNRRSTYRIFIVVNREYLNNTLKLLIDRENK